MIEILRTGGGLPPVVWLVLTLIFRLVVFDRNMTIEITAVGEQSTNDRKGNKLQQSCDCWTNSSTSNEDNMFGGGNPCCRRIVHYSHKMGSVLVQDLFSPERNVVGVELSFNPPGHHVLRNGYFLEENSKRHREVMVVRNIVSSIISGYLYHKSGRECWLDKNGERPVGSDKLTALVLDRWETMVKHRKFPWKPGKGRNLCQYLSEESEYDGLRAYVDIALEMWYKRIYSYWVLLHKWQVHNPLESPRSNFVCFEDLNSDKQAKTFHEIMDWLYPDGRYDGRNDPIASGGVYNGGHASDHDPLVRARLREIIHRIDKEMLNHWIQKADLAFGCGLDTEAREG